MPADFPTVVRLTLEFVLWLVILRYAHFMVIYVRVIWPLRQDIDEGMVIAPPARTTLAYHLIVWFVLLLQAGATLYGLARELPFNPFLAPMIPSQIALLWVIHRFTREYAKRLKKNSSGANP